MIANNPVRRALEQQKPFSFFHTHVIDRPILDAAVAAGKSLEVDMSITDDDEIYVGHPLSHYAAMNLPPPQNLPLDTILSEMKAAALFLVLDCKDVRVLPKAREVIEDYGPENSLYHSWSNALILDPYLEKWDVIQPNWAGEELPHDEIMKLRKATGVPMILSCHRGLTAARLKTDGNAIADQIAEILGGNAEGVSFSLPPGQIPPMPFMSRLLEHGITPNIHLDEIPPEARPPVYMGWTDDLRLASDPRDL